MKIQPHFKSIRYEILKAIENAKEHIQIAVCWFTNEELFSAICNKIENGISVELIILDDYINSQPYGCDFSKFIELGGDLFLSDVERPMHNKYCIIDNKYLINGSYNWTYFAEIKNEENIIVFEDCNTLIDAFRSDFIRLKSITKKVDIYKKLSLLDFSNQKLENKSRNVFSTFNMLSNDLFYKSIETNDQTYYNAAKRITPDNVYFQKKAIELKWENPLKLTSTLCEEIKGNQVSVIFPKGTLIPANSSKNFTTINDYQVEMKITLLRGESDKASLNSTIRYYQLKGIPSLKAGEASIKTEYKITLDGILHITKYIHDTGLVDKRTFDLTTFNLISND